MKKRIPTELAAILGVLTKLALAAELPGPTVFKHVPYDQNWCDLCHQTDTAGKVKPGQFTATQPDLCYQCHDRKTTGSVVHPALSMGDCTSMCHDPHQSSFRPLLRDKVSGLCVQCHDAPGIDQAVRHSAVDMVKSCVRCHNPHSADQPKLLREETPKLCVYCHKDLGKALADPLNHKHPAIEFGCQACHQPHGSANSRLTQKPLNDLCYQCHDENTFKNGHPINGHPLVKPQDPLFPEKQFTCISCHKPHFSRNEKLLRYRFKKGEGPYDGTICSVCHWQKLLPPPGPPRPKWND